jgi:hypothetical protein
MPSPNQRKRKSKTSRRKKLRRPVVGGGSPKVINSQEDDDGLSKLQIFLQDYDRVSINTLCTNNVDKVSVWLYEDNMWGLWTDNKSQKLLDTARELNASVCKHLMTNVFKLDDLQYQTMKNSFLATDWRDVAGVYKRRGVKGDYALVVWSPLDVPYGSLIVGYPMAGLVLGSIAGGILPGAKFANTVKQKLQPKPPA